MNNKFIVVTTTSLLVISAAFLIKIWAQDSITDSTSKPIAQESAVISSFNVDSSRKEKQIDFTTLAFPNQMSYDYTIIYENNGEATDTVVGRLMLKGTDFIDSSTIGIKIRARTDLFSLNHVSKTASYLNIQTSPINDGNLISDKLVLSSSITDSLYHISQTSDIFGDTTIYHLSCIPKTDDRILSKANLDIIEFNGQKALKNAYLEASDMDYDGSTILMKLYIEDVRYKVDREISTSKYITIIGTSISLNNKYRDYKLITF